MTQKEIILIYLESVGRWIPSYRIRSIDTPFGWLGHQADREARRMAKSGDIEVRHTGKYAEYRAKQDEVNEMMCEKCGKYYKYMTDWQGKKLKYCNH